MVYYQNSIDQKDKDPEMSSKLKSVIEGRKISSNMMEKEDAAALVLRADLTQDPYNIIKSLSDSWSAHFIPNHNYMLDEKLIQKKLFGLKVS